MNSCNLCPRKCKVDRQNGEIGYCGCDDKMVIARYSLHKWEEPCISGEFGSGTIFFSYCNLRCLFCQNYDISTLHKGIVVSVEKFCDICIELQERGASNINLVTAVMYIPMVVEGLLLAKSKGLHIPIIYNSSGYESIEGLRMLEGLVDIYLPDFKYYDNKLGMKYSNCPKYFDCASLALAEMYRQVGRCEFDDEGMLVRGVIVRHLILPGCYEDSKKVIKFLFDNYRNNIFISIMNQYTPVRKLEYEELNRTIDDFEYDSIIDYAYDMGVRNAFVQDGETQRESFIPNFDEFVGI